MGLVAPPPVEFAPDLRSDLRFQHEPDPWEGAPGDHFPHNPDPWAGAPRGHFQHEVCFHNLLFVKGPGDEKV